MSAALPPRFAGLTALTGSSAEPRMGTYVMAVRVNGRTLEAHVRSEQGESSCNRQLKRRRQPASALTAWYQRKFGGGSRRFRRIGIVALARRLLIALWRYEHGEIPEGALLKVA